MKNNYYRFTELDFSEKWAHLFKNDFKWVNEKSCWFYWDGFRWKEDLSRKVYKTADRLLPEIRQDLMAAIAELKEKTKDMDDSQTKAIQKKKFPTYNESLIQELFSGISRSKRTIESIPTSRGIKNILDLAASQPDVSASYSDFDSKGHYIGVQNGIVDLRTGELADHNSSYLITKSCSTVYDPTSKCPSWINFLETVFSDDPDTIDLLQRIAGQTLLGTPEKDKLIILNGTGANGKSTFIDTIKNLLGDYAITMDSEAITQKTGGDKGYYKATLRGSRLALLNETDQGVKLDESFVKSIVDSGEISAREIYGRPFCFQPVATSIMATNYLPRISSNHSIKRRLIVIPFSKQIPESQRKANFRKAYLEPELSGILNWMIEGLHNYYTSGLKPSKTVLDYTNEYFSSNDRVSTFIEQSCFESPSSKIKLQDIKKAYALWAEQSGYKSVGNDRLSQEMRDRGYNVRKSSGGIFWVFGLILKPPEFSGYSS